MKVRILMMKDFPMLENTPLEEAIIGVNASWVAPNRKIENGPIAEMVHRCRGTRSYGSAAIELAYVSTGRIDAYLSLRLVAVGYCRRDGYCTGSRCTYDELERRAPSLAWPRYIYRCYGQDCMMKFLEIILFSNKKRGLQLCGPFIK